MAQHRSNMAEHLRISKLVMNRVGLQSLGPEYQAKIDRDTSLLHHRLWDHHPGRLFDIQTPEELAEWIIHLAVDYELCPAWYDEAQSPRKRRT
jgi:hypothetical protein